jgi:hypothetical protein
MTIRAYIQTKNLQKLDDEQSKTNPTFYPTDLMDGIPVSNAIEIYFSNDRSCWVCLDLSANRFILFEGSHRKVSGGISDDCPALGKK